MKELKEVRLEDVKGGEDRIRDRQSLGDLELLKVNITITVTASHTSNNLEKCNKEYAENFHRNNFNFSELMKIADEIEPIVIEESRENKGSKGCFSIKELGLKDVKGSTRDIMADYLGFGSGTTYDRARKIWKSQNKEIIHKLDIGEISIFHALQMVKELQANEENFASHNKHSPKKNNSVSRIDRKNSPEGNVKYDEYQDIFAIPVGKEDEFDFFDMSLDDIFDKL